jgi:hypothetical protein
MKTRSSIQQTIRYSRGVDKYDNKPKQMASEDFDAFEQAILADRSPAKGTTYFTGPLSFGPHDRPEKYPHAAHYRLATRHQSRRFIAMDFDGFSSPDVFSEVFDNLKAFRGFGYTTWSHTEEKPRARAVFELGREVTRVEGIALGRALDRLLESVFGDGAVTLDQCVYQNEQQVYSPGPNARIFHFNGKVIDVDDLLSRFPDPMPEPFDAMETGKGGTDGVATAQSYAKVTLDSLVRILGMIDCNYEPTWFAVCNALARVYGEAGRDVFQRFSSGEFSGTACAKYNPHEADEKFTRAIRELSGKSNGYGVRHLMRLSGLRMDQVEFETPLVHLVQGGMPTSQVAFSALNKNNKPLQVSENLDAVLAANSITVRYNQISKSSEVLVPGLSCVLDETDNTAMNSVTDYALRAGMTPSRIPEMLSALAAQRPYCPVQAYITAASWDGISRFSQFTGQIACGNPTVALLLWRKWLIQAVAAVFEHKGISNAGVLALTGAQGVGKTLLFKDLTSEIPDVFLEGQTLNPADKDSVMSTVSHWIVELGELDSTFRKADLAQLKAFITKSQDTLRRPYARKDSNFPRRTVFAGTVNDSEFLHDPTGNRRFWPIDVHSINRDTSIDYQQLWAEVKSWYDAGEKWYLNQTETDMLRQYSEIFVVNDPDVETLLTKYAFAGCNNWAEAKMQDICVVIGIERPSRSQTMRLAEAIRRHNGGKRPRESNGVKYHYVPAR